MIRIQVPFDLSDGMIPFVKPPARFVNIQNKHEALGEIIKPNALFYFNLAIGSKRYIPNIR